MFRSKNILPTPFSTFYKFQSFFNFSLVLQNIVQGCVSSTKTCSEIERNGLIDIDGDEFVFFVKLRLFLTSDSLGFLDLIQNCFVEIISLLKQRF